MATKPSLSRRGPGRPLPTPDPGLLRQAHRLTSVGEAGALLRLARAARGLSQADMATQLGISRQMLVGVEAGADGIAAGTLLRMLADLGIVVLALPPDAAADPQAALGLDIAVNTDAPIRRGRGWTP